MVEIEELDTISGGFSKVKTGSFVYGLFEVGIISRLSGQSQKSALLRGRIMRDFK
ncbi:hypothetical protein DET59_10341 [Rossellomorea aquimaris]|uniref:Uncharacterized protein n=1 Tax=Rossellomorea aquimaris TaxID=189382 RepID=A0A366EWQ7_9BACI|nr:hypothetical protein DET59_10341 [Rossellomorea aquimaris]